MAAANGTGSGQDVAWRCLHVYYYDPDKDALLLDAVRPFLAEIGPQVELAYVVRHWRQGPHLRINVRCGRAVWEAMVRPSAWATVGGFLRDHPSTVVVDQSAALERHKVLAEVEQDRGALSPWFPDNSIREAPYESRAHVLGEGGAALLAEFYHDSNRQLFEMLVHARAGRDSRLGLAVSLLFAVAHLAPGGITRGFSSYRAHAEGHLMSYPDPAPVRAGFDAAYRARREALARRMREVVATLESSGVTATLESSGVTATLESPGVTATLESSGTGAAVPFVAAWAALVSRYGDRAAGMMQRGELTLPVLPVLPGSEEAGLPEAVRRSELHRLVLTSPAYHDRVLASPAFLRHRVLLNYTYLHLTRLGLSPLDRFRACHLVASTVEEVHGVTAVAQLRRYLEGASSS